jgi:splicing factor U2AF subunit
VSCSYGFVVYSDPNVTDVACAGLNGLKMGDRTLTVRRAAEVSSAVAAVDE